MYISNEIKIILKYWILFLLNVTPNINRVILYLYFPISCTIPINENPGLFDKKQNRASSQKRDGHIRIRYKLYIDNEF